MQNSDLNDWDYAIRFPVAAHQPYRTFKLRECAAGSGAAAGARRRLHSIEAPGANGLIQVYAATGVLRLFLQGLGHVGGPKCSG